MLYRKPVAELLPPCCHQPQQEDIHQRDRDAKGGESEIVDCHCSTKQQHRRQTKRVHGDAARQQAGDLLIGGNPTGDITGMALREELKRQHHQAPKESARRDNGKLGLQP